MGQYMGVERTYVRNGPTISARYTPDTTHPTLTAISRNTCHLWSLIRLIIYITLNPYFTVEPSFVQGCIKDLSKGKAGGVDGVSHEHLLAASGVSAPIFANIYTWMLRLGHVPESMIKIKTSRNTMVVRSGRTSRAIIEPLHSRPLFLSCMKWCC